MNILVIGDSHAHPDHNNRRFDWLGRFIVDTQPDVIVDIGDWADMPSLCSYDKGVKSEGRRYRADIECAIDARDRVHGHINLYNVRRRALKKSQYNPRKIALLGNHEHRITKAASVSPELHGTISTEDLRTREFGWEVYDFLTPVVIEGVVFNHYFTSGNYGAAIGGDNVAAQMITKNHTSSVCGHNHYRDFAERTTADGRKLTAVSVGAYMDYIPEWIGNNGNKWWFGLVMLHNVKNGTFDPEFIGMEVIKERYESN